MRKTRRMEEKSSDQKDFKSGFEIQHTIVFTDDLVNFIHLICIKNNIHQLKAEGCNQ